VSVATTRRRQDEDEDTVKETFRIAVLMTIITTVIFGLIYPFAVTGLAQLLFPSTANGSLIYGHASNGQATVVGSRLLGQTFTGPGYFHSRPSMAGDGYDAANSGGSNLAPTNHALLDRVKGDVEKLRAENPGAAIPVDLVTTSASGLDPDISPDAAEFQIPRVAKERGMSVADLRALVARHTLGRQFGVLGEPRVNVLELNMELDATSPVKK
jgi:K+-transporting ATPase ATPase C chain